MFKYECTMLHMQQRLSGGHCVHSVDGSTFLHEMTSWAPRWKCDVKSKTLCQL